MAWIESHQEIARHPKTRRLARLLKVSVPAAIGHLHLLWWWALDYAEDGWLGRYSAEDIAEAVMWKGKPQVLWDALCECGWFNKGAEGAEIHDWETYAGRLLEQRRKDAERKRTARARPAPVHPPSGGRPPDIQQPSNGTPAPVRGMSDVTVPNRTVPNRTVPNLTRPNQDPPNAPNGASPRGNPKVQAVKDAFRERGLEPAMSGRDYAAIKQSTAPPGLIAETYLAVADREYGDDFMRKRLSVHEAVDWVNGYCEQRLEAAWSRDEELDRLHKLGYNPVSTAKGA